MQLQIYSALVAFVLTSAARAAPYALELAYLVTNFPGLPDGPGIGCGPVVTLYGQNGPLKPGADNRDVLHQSDQCPFNTHFCSRWKCPKSLHFEDGNLAFNILRDEGDKVAVEGWKYKGGWQTVMCDVSRLTTKYSDGLRTERTHICYFEL